MSKTATAERKSKKGEAEAPDADAPPAYVDDVVEVPTGQVAVGAEIGFVAGMLNRKAADGYEVVELFAERSDRVGMMRYRGLFRLAPDPEAMKAMATADPARPPYREGYANVPGFAAAMAAAAVAQHDDGYEPLFRGTFPEETGYNGIVLYRMIFVRRG